jgi:NAD(P)-dependent dehydrogenase (short-subunit alcohol dehydrogenase family)
MTAYSQTKQADRMLSWKWADELRAKGVTVNAYMPGFIRSEFQRNASGFMGMMIRISARLFAKSPTEGADTGVWLASSKDVEGVTGKLFEGRKEKECKFRDPAPIATLWDLCEGMTASGAIRAVA